LYMASTLFHRLQVSYNMEHEIQALEGLYRGSMSMFYLEYIPILWCSRT
jgi:hypothetical protein